MDSTPKTARIFNRALDERAHIGALRRYLTERGHAPRTMCAYLDCAAHFCQWAERSDLGLGRFDEAVIERFVDHLPRCDCTVANMQ